MGRGEHVGFYCLRRTACNISKNNSFYNEFYKFFHEVKPPVRGDKIQWGGGRAGPGPEPQPRRAAPSRARPAQGWGRSGDGGVGWGEGFGSVRWGGAGVGWDGVDGGWCGETIGLQTANIFNFIASGSPPKM